MLFFTRQQTSRIVRAKIASKHVNLSNKRAASGECATESLILSQYCKKVMQNLIGRRDLWSSCKPPFCLTSTLGSFEPGISAHRRGDCHSVSCPTAF